MDLADRPNSPSFDQLYDGIRRCDPWRQAAAMLLAERQVGRRLNSRSYGPGFLLKWVVPV